MISSDIAGFYYDYEVCDKKVLGVCVRKKLVRDNYDLNDPVVRKQLKDMGFIATTSKKMP